VVRMTSLDNGLLRDFETYIVAYSGGKDSSAMAVWALENLPHEQLRFIYNPTGADPTENEWYLPCIERKLGIEILTIRAGDRMLPPKRNGKPRYAWEKATNLYDMIRLRGMWPCETARYCTVYLKQWPTVLWARAETRNPILLMGQRKEESKTRSRLPKFSPDRNYKQVQDGLPVFRPILDWSEDDVWYCLDNAGIMKHPVYNRSSRCNCTVCFEMRRVEMLRQCQFDPSGMARWARLEQEIKHTWKHRQSIGNLLRQAQAQMALFTVEPRFAEVAS